VTAVPGITPEKISLAIFLDGRSRRFLFWFPRKTQNCEQSDWRLVRYNPSRVTPQLDVIYR
jgi:hypothetical protein